MSSVLGIAKLGFPPHYQGKGLGKRLLEALVDEARRRHLNIGVASAEGPSFSTGKRLGRLTDFPLTRSSGRLEAVGFYNKFGFVEVTPPRMLGNGKVVGVRRDLWVDCVVCNSGRSWLCGCAWAAPPVMILSEQLSDVLSFFVLPRPTRWSLNLFRLSPTE